jgi:hypothetical protein
MDDQPPFVSSLCRQPKLHGACSPENGHIGVSNDPRSNRRAREAGGCFVGFLGYGTRATCGWVACLSDARLCQVDRRFPVSYYQC